MTADAIPLSIASEFGTLHHVIAGRGAGFHRAPEYVEVVNATQAASGHPNPAAVDAELTGFHEALRQAGVEVLVPELAPVSVQDQTCPRDIGFVIGNTFVEASMTSPGRAEELEGIAGLLARCDGPRLATPANVRLEGGDVVVAGQQVFVGHGQRSDPEGAAFLAAAFPDHQIISLPCVHGTDRADVLHLDCTFNPLGLGHALIFPPGLAQIPDALHAYDWIEVTPAEAYALATNVFSIAPDHIIARDHPDCARVNAALRQAGYRVTELSFDAVPSIGGSFRCATLPLARG